MKLQSMIVPLLAAVVLASGCASTEARYGSNDYGAGHSNENFYAVIDSIQSSPAIGGALIGRDVGKASGPQNIYLIRVRFDDRSYRTVTQTGLDGLRVGDSVRIEHDRVRHY
jgi:outer membrane lipoprotein SlyB